MTKSFDPRKILPLIEGIEDKEQMKPIQQVEAQRPVQILVVWITHCRMLQLNCWLQHCLEVWQDHNYMGHKYVDIPM